MAKKKTTRAAKKGRRTPKRIGKKTSASRVAGRKSKKAKKMGGKSAVRPARKTARQTSTRKTPRYGEGGWKADEEYREGLRKFSESDDARQLAREAAEKLEPDLRDSENADGAQSARRGAEEEPEW